MKRKIFVMLLAAALTVTSAVSVLAEGAGTGNEERIAEIEAEIASLQAELAELTGGAGASEGTDAAGTDAGTATDAAAEDIQVLADYTEGNGTGYVNHFIVIKNNTGETLDVSTSSLAYDEAGTMVAATDSYQDAVGSGCTTIIREYYDTEAMIGSYETTINSSPSEYYASVLQDLSYVQNDISSGAVFQVTNNGQEPAEYVEGYALFFLDGKLVDYYSTYFTDDDGELKPGKTISKQMDSYEDFDAVEFYLTGSRYIN